MIDPKENSKSSTDRQPLIIDDKEGLNEKDWLRILIISADLLQLRFELIQGAVYCWSGGGPDYTIKVSQVFSTSPHSALEAGRIVSSPLIKAVRRPAVIVGRRDKPGDDDPADKTPKKTYRIIIPLWDGRRKVAALVYRVSTKHNIRQIKGIGRLLAAIQTTATRVANSFILNRRRTNFRSVESPLEDEASGRIFTPSTEIARTSVDTAPIDLNREVEKALQTSGLLLMAFGSEGEMIPGFPLGSKLLEKATNNTLFEILFHSGQPVNQNSTSFSPHPNENLISDMLCSAVTNGIDIDALVDLLPAIIRQHNRQVRLKYQLNDSGREDGQKYLLVLCSELDNSNDETDSGIPDSQQAAAIYRIATDPSRYLEFKSDVEKTIQAAFQELSKDIGEVDLREIANSLRIVRGMSEFFELAWLSDRCDRIVEEIEWILDKKHPVSQVFFDDLFSWLTSLDRAVKTYHHEFLDGLLPVDQTGTAATYRVSENKLDSIISGIVSEAVKNRMGHLESLFEKNYLPFTRIRNLEDVTIRRLNTLKRYIREHVTRSVTDEIRLAFDRIRYQPAKDLLHRYGRLAENLAARFGKKLVVQIKSGELEMPVYRYRRLFDYLIFLVRHIVEFEIESPPQNYSAENLPTGILNIEALMEADTVIIRLSDNGKRSLISSPEWQDYTSGQLSIDSTAAEKTGSDGNRERNNLVTAKPSPGKPCDPEGLKLISAALEELDGNLQIEPIMPRGTGYTVRIPLKGNSALSPD